MVNPQDYSPDTVFTLLSVLRDEAESAALASRPLTERKVGHRLVVSLQERSELLAVGLAAESAISAAA